MINIAPNIDYKFRPILNARSYVFDNTRMTNLFENRINRIYSKLYDMDVFIHEQLKQNIYEATKIWEGKR
jgi:hypothetical protein